MDDLLFNLLVLGSLTDKNGYVWQKCNLHLYIIESVPPLSKIRQVSVFLQIPDGLTCSRSKHASGDIEKEELGT